ncbi:head maturation protease, ClpP-related [Virgibacillus sp. DJP39]|uniref:head maturation protease, ClpP-related n=1 Tax=Virgibacillus sp. DJP39 TaxID=3409790 RepID=UPI003BB80F47
MDKFWRWVMNEAGEKPVRILHMEGYIAESSWFDDDITPKQFKTELYEGGEPSDDIVVKLHSPGGDCFAAAQIYNMLKEYPGHISIQVDGLAASAASVIAMAGDEVCVSPLSVLMIHNPAMLVAGEVSDLESGINLLSEVKESIMNAYQTKTGLSRLKISNMMNAETWMSAHKAIELKFADRVLYENAPTDDQADGFIYDKLTVTNALINKLPGIQAKMPQIVAPKATKTPEETDENKQEVDRIPVNQLEKRLELIKNWR